MRITRDAATLTFFSVRRGLTDKSKFIELVCDVEEDN